MALRIFVRKNLIEIAKKIYYFFVVPKKMNSPDPQNSNAWRKYYEKAESCALNQFDVYFEPILAKYKDISFDRVLDFACGYGRMANVFSKISKSIICCDIDSNATDFCAKRFQDNKGCSFEFINNIRENNTLHKLPLESNSVSLVYSWDAMVHFSYKWLDFYILEFYRILAPDSYCIIHHSNFSNTSDVPDENWYAHPNWRASVSSEDVAFIAQNHGFTVVEQKIIDWGNPDLDCISILKK